MSTIKFQASSVTGPDGNGNMTVVASSVGDELTPLTTTSTVTIVGPPGAVPAVATGECFLAAISLPAFQN